MYVKINQRFLSQITLNYIEMTLKRFIWVA